MVPAPDKPTGPPAPRRDGGAPAAPSLTPAGRLPPRPGAGAWDDAFSQLQQRVSRIIADLSARSGAPAGGEPAERPAADRLAVASKRLEDSRAAHRAELNMLMERLKARSEPRARRGESAAATREAVGEELRQLDQRLEQLKTRMTATVDAMASAVEEVMDLRRVVQDYRGDLAKCHQTEAELAANQRQMAESMNVLHDLVTRSTELSRSNAAWVEVLAQGPENRYVSLQEQLTRATARVETRSTIQLIAAGAGLLAGVSALVIALAK